VCVLIVCLVLTNDGVLIVFNFLKISSLENYSFL
jgi:hypothetical protein